MSSNESESGGSSFSSSSSNNNRQHKRRSTDDRQHYGRSKHSRRDYGHDRAHLIDESSASSSSSISLSSPSSTSSPSASPLTTPSQRSSGPSSSSQSSSSSSSSCGAGSDHSRCLYVTGVFKSGNSDLLESYRRHYSRPYNAPRSNQSTSPSKISTSTPSSSSISALSLPEVSGALPYPVTPFLNQIPPYAITSGCPPIVQPYNIFPTNNEPVMSLVNSDKFNRANCNECKYKNPDTLLELASKAVAANVSYETIERHTNRIPIPIQERIIFWSFPRDDSYLRLYSSISSVLIRNKFSTSVESELRTLSFNSTTSVHDSNQQTGSLSTVSSSSPPSSSGGPSYGQQRSITNRPAVLPNPFDSANPNHSARLLPPLALSYENRLELEQHQLASLFKAGDIIFAKGSVKNVIQIGFTLNGIVCDGIIEKSFFYEPRMQPVPTYLPRMAMGNPFWTHPSHLQLIQHAYLPPSQNFDYPSQYSSSNSTSDQYSVSITFEKCKITQVHCTCNSKKTLVWCEHVVALALHRIRKPYDMELRLPISESIENLDIDQLKKLLLYTISEHHIQVLPTVQKLVDELQNKNTPINQICGAPDPTAGSCSLTDIDWYFNEQQLKIQISSLAKNVNYSEAIKLLRIFQRIGYMLKIQDTNARKFLTIITNEFVSGYHVCTEHTHNMFGDPFAFLWDHLINLWVFIICDPRLNNEQRQKIRVQLYSYMRNNNCFNEYSNFSLEIVPRKDDNDDNYSEGAKRSFSNFSPNNIHHSSDEQSTALSRSNIFRRPIQASFIQWDDRVMLDLVHNDHLGRDHFGLRQFNWGEHLPTAALRIATLRIHGNKMEALRLAVGVVRHQCEQIFDTIPTCSNINDSWIGHPLEPIAIIFDTLAEASLKPGAKGLEHYYGLYGYDRKIEPGDLIKLIIKRERNPQLETPQSNAVQPNTEPSPKKTSTPKYQNVIVPESNPNQPITYLSMALRMAIVGLSQFRQAPCHESVQRDVYFRQELRLFARMYDLNCKNDPILIDTIKEQARSLLRIGLLSEKIKLSSIPADIVQIPALGHFMFSILTAAPTDDDSIELAFDVGLRTIRHLSLSVDFMPETMFKYYRDQQLLLVKTMLLYAHSDANRLEVILTVLKIYLERPACLSLLAQEVFNIASNKPTYPLLMEVAFKLNLFLCEKIKDDSAQGSLRRATHDWMVGCAAEIGYDNLFHMVHYWKRYFSPLDAVSHIGMGLHTNNLQTPCYGLNFRIDTVKNGLLEAVRQMAVECTYEDPNCAMSAMSICYRHPKQYSELTRIVEKAATEKRLTPTRIFNIAHIMKKILFTLPDGSTSSTPSSVSDAEALCRIILLAVKAVPPHTSNVPIAIAALELNWGCDVIAALRKYMIPEFINAVVEHIHSATVIGEVLLKCIEHHLKDVYCRKSYVSSHPEYEFLHIFFSNYPDEPLSRMTNATADLYVAAIYERLTNISPRHYCEFVSFLAKAREFMLYKPTGKEEFESLINQIKAKNKGKKKLLMFVKEKFSIGC